MMPLAFEIEDGIDHMLQCLRPREVAILGDVANENSRNVLTFRSKQELRRRFAHLSDAAGRRLELDGKDRLYRVDDNQGRFEARDFLEDAFDARFREQVERRCTDTQSIATALDLMLGLLAGRIEDWSDVGGEMGRRLQQQRGLADARFAAQQYERTWHDAAAEHAIELTDARWKAHSVRRFNVCVQLRRGRCTKLRVPIVRRRARRGFGCRPFLDKRIPRAAFDTFPHPLGRLRAALLTDEDSFRRFHAYTLSILDPIRQTTS